MISKRTLLVASAARPGPAGPRALRARSSDVGRAGQIALMLQLLDDPLDQLVEPLLRIVGLLPVLAEQLLERLVGEQPAVQDRFEDGVVQRLRRMPRLVVVVVRQPVRAVEAAREQQVGQLRQQILEVDSSRSSPVNLE